MNCVSSFFEKGSMHTGANMTWVTLAPKIDDVKEMKDYRPISMVGCIYKTIPKVLANRIRHVMDGPVGETQTAFAQGQQILDGALIACKVIHWLKSKKKEAVIMKLDFHKAYDSVRWDFVDHVLNRMGFGQVWPKWIWACISSAEMSIIINGSATKPFRMEHGLRQGDPLSPFLFVLVVDVLNRLLSKAVSCGLVEGIEVGSHRVGLSHLQFADDTILFAPSKKEVLVSLRHILGYFGLMSGLNINYEKLAIIPLNCNDAVVFDLSRSLQCEVLSLSVKYLGI